MTHLEFRAAVKRLDISLAQLARELDVNVRTVRGWASAKGRDQGKGVRKKQHVPAAVALLLKCWLEKPRARRHH